MKNTITTELTFIIREEEAPSREGRRSRVRSAGATWFTCKCCSIPSSENLCGSASDQKDLIISFA